MRLDHLLSKELATVWWFVSVGALSESSLLWGSSGWLLALSHAFVCGRGGWWLVGWCLLFRFEGACCWLFHGWLL